MVGRPFSYESTDDGARVVVRGELDELGVAALRDLALAAVTVPQTEAPRVEVDLSLVDFIWSIAAGDLVRAQRAVAARGGDLVVRARDGSIAQRVLSLCGVPHVA